jgi:hypothetical protein
VAGLWPGLARYQGGVRQPEPQTHVLTTLKQQPAPVLGWAQKLKLRS